MRKPRISNQERERLLKLADKKGLLFKRKRRLYNRLYRKSLLFIGSWGVRLLFVGMFITAGFIFNKAKKTNREKVMSSNVSSIRTESGHGTYETTTLYLQTNKESYTANFTDFKLPVLNTNDSITVERNLFGKAIYFTNPGWNWRYSIDGNFYFYFAIMVFTLISFSFNDGLDRFTSKIIFITAIVDVITCILFFLI